MNLNDEFNKASSVFFFLGAIFSKIGMLGVFVLNLLSLCCYGMGYLFSSLYCFFNQQPREAEQKWAGFTAFQKQGLLYSLIGLIGTLFGIKAFFSPIFFVPATLCFLASNFLWMRSEQNKSESYPKDDPECLPPYQKAYTQYAELITAMSAVNALSATLILFFPQLTLPTYAVSTTVNALLSLLLVELFASYNYNKSYKEVDAVQLEKIVETTSYQRLTEALGIKTSYDQEAQSPKEKVVYHNLLKGELPAPDPDLLIDLEYTCPIL